MKCFVCSLPQVRAKKALVKGRYLIKARYNPNPYRYIRAVVAQGDIGKSDQNTHTSCRGNSRLQVDGEHFSLARRKCKDPLGGVPGISVTVLPYCLDRVEYVLEVPWYIYTGIIAT